MKEDDLSPSCLLALFLVKIAVLLAALGAGLCAARR